MQMNTVGEEVLETYEGRIKNLWSYMEKDLDMALVNDKIEELSIEAIDITRRLRKLKSFLKKKRI